VKQIINDFKIEAIPCYQDDNEQDLTMTPVRNKDALKHLQRGAKTEKVFAPSLEQTPNTEAKQHSPPTRTQTSDLAVIKKLKYSKQIFKVTKEQFEGRPYSATGSVNGIEFTLRYPSGMDYYPHD
jgi:hypothetical protein